MSAGIAGLHAGDALVVVDVQQDFLPGGSLAVGGGDAVIPELNHCAKEFEWRGLPVFATRDWHPPAHCSFLGQGGPWPPHCIAGTPGAEMPVTLRLPPATEVISKATSRERDAYSGFQNTELAARLRACGCGRIFIGGLATDYCVRATALDGLRLGFSVVVLEDAIKAVELQIGDGARALADMIAAGARVTRLRDLVA